MKLEKKYLILAALILCLGIFLRLYHIEFGLPQSFHADEPEIAEPAIKYTYEIRNIIKNGDYYQLFPISFVYGTFPAYFFTAATMAFSKTSNILGISFDKTTLYIFMRTVNALFSMLIVVASAILSFKLKREKLVFFLVLALGALNWKLIVHAHYLNADIILTTLLSLSYLTLYSYFKGGPDNKYTVLTAILFGLALGTKITALLGLPLFLYLFWQKRDYMGIVGFLVTALLAYLASNPFSLILPQRLSLRILEMFSHEGGLVFDSADLTVYKYILALGFITTPLILLTSLTGMYRKIKDRFEYPFHYFLLGNVAIYLLFFTLQSRRVDRWLLPILPIVLIYAGLGISYLFEKLKNKWVTAMLALILTLSYCYFPALLLKQFQRYTPKAESYLWIKDNLDLSKRFLVYTEEGLDPLNKLPFSKVVTVPVYASEDAQYYLPEDPQYYSYVVISSRPMQNFKRPAVKDAYPFYYQGWLNFEQELQDPQKFVLIKEFALPKPNLIELSDVYIYKNSGEVKKLPLIDDSL